LTGSLNYLTEQEQLISIPPKPAGPPTLALTQEQTNLNLWITLLVLPVLVVCGGLAVWWRPPPGVSKGGRQGGSPPSDNGT